MSDDHNYFEFHEEESECPTKIWEETVLTAATGSECATASASVTRDCNPGLLFQSRDFGIEKCQSQDPGIESLILK